MKTLDRLEQYRKEKLAKMRLQEELEKQAFQKEMVKQRKKDEN